MDKIINGNNLENVMIYMQENADVIIINHILNVSNLQILIYLCENYLKKLNLKKIFINRIKEKPLNTDIICYLMKFNKDILEEDNIEHFIDSDNIIKYIIDHYLHLYTEEIMFLIVDENRMDLFDYIEQKIGSEKLIQLLKKCEFTIVSIDMFDRLFNLEPFCLYYLDIFGTLCLCNNDYNMLTRLLMLSIFTNMRINKKKLIKYYTKLGVEYKKYIDILKN